jgi:hypothetical protein
MLLPLDHRRPQTIGMIFRGGLATAVRRHKKAPDDAGAFELPKFSRDQYFATTGPAQLKR